MSDVFFNQLAYCPPKDKVGIIYGLIDPRYDLIRYDGQTVVTLESRFEGHLVEAQESKNNTKKLVWIRKLLSLGLKPIPVLLAYDIPVPFITYLQNDFVKEGRSRFKPFFDYDALDKEEQYFISASREECASFGIDCVNGNSGGHGEGSQHRPSHEGKKHSKEWNEHISNGRKRQEPWNKGLTNETDERIAKKSEAQRNSERFQTAHRSAEFRQKVSKSQEIRHFKNFIVTLKTQVIEGSWA